jgi:hypothetical protein
LFTLAKYSRTWQGWPIRQIGSRFGLDLSIFDYRRSIANHLGDRTLPNSTLAKIQAPLGKGNSAHIARESRFPDLATSAQAALPKKPILLKGPILPSRVSVRFARPPGSRSTSA